VRSAPAGEHVGGSVGSFGADGRFHDGVDRTARVGVSVGLIEKTLRVD
jgi:hypothetical protein